jgi:hypothetical protein
MLVAAMRSSQPEKFFNFLNIKTYYFNKTKDGLAKMLSLDIFSVANNSWG